MFSQIWSRFLWSLSYGPLVEKGWRDLGGVECLEAIPFHIRLLESGFWLLSAILFYKCMDIRTIFQIDYELIAKEAQKHKPHAIVRAVELIVGIITVFIFSLIMFYKFYSLSGAYVVQPCHIVCLLEGLALIYPNNPLSVFVAMYVLPTMSGSIMALVFPENDDLLLPFEVEVFWIEHYLIVLVPLYLLARNEGIAMKFAYARCWHNIAIGLWYLLILHFLVHEALTYATLVNVEFMLCPTKKMEDIFSSVFGSSQRVAEIFGTHRTLMTLVVFTAGTIVSHLYLLVAAVFVYFNNGKSSRKETTAIEDKIK